ncbi:DUF6912 family protein [Ruania halotolerans]|uniref:DUF6912 family protein n=1 Tax=Ruania halotolerans TaxID=2897773 RepID=UPI001E40755C|nr:hypothetical protein [Ruania halotolerans]UFU07606.1 hypothetical protein LQF10_05755 [Ruania halotolerans]
MRVYLPATVAELAEPSGLPARTGRAVTAALRTALGADADEEMAEYAALILAAEDSLANLTESDAMRRLVVAADVPDSAVRDAAGREAGAELARVHVPEVPFADVVSFHVDAADAHTLALVARALSGDEQAVAEIGAEDLLWYDVSEREVLLAEV